MGGFIRKGDSASAAWVVIEKTRITSGGKRTMWDGTHYTKRSSILVEAIALEKATSMVRDRHAGRTISRKGILFNFESASYRAVVRA